MNFLAHCLIATRAAHRTEDAALVAGGFLGDFIKGPLPQEMPRGLALGVRLHRRIDAYSNQHPGIRTSSRRFPAELRRIAPILVDVLCDHLLSSRWEEFHAASLPGFTTHIYDVVASHEEWLTDNGHRFLAYARERDLLASYADWEVVLGALRSITRRLGRNELNPLLERAVPALLADLEADFVSYFPDIIDHARFWVAGEREPDC